MTQSQARKNALSKGGRRGNERVMPDWRGAELKQMPIRLLKPHERIDSALLDDLVKVMKKDNVIKKAIVADRKTHVILDGHHRVKALEILNCDKVPCLLVNYSSPQIVALSWRGGSELPKSLIVEAGLTGKLLPPKTSKHMLRLNGRMIHISAIEPEVNVPLAMLKSKSSSFIC